MSRDDGFPGSDGGGRGCGWVAIVVVVRDEVIGVDVVEHGRAEKRTSRTCGGGGAEGDRG